ncbi:MAG: hypothetical protein Q4G03_08215 [Planctomycetia bacterium]|nr:hypothetical protein [Planctomycetia bacterium]
MEQVELQRVPRDACDSERPISSSLESLRRQALGRAWRGERARLETLLAFLGALASLASHFHGAWVKYAIALCLVCAVAIVIVTILRWRLGRPSLEQVAARLQRRYESFDGLLVAALEFEIDCVCGVSDSQELRDATRSRVVRAIRGFLAHPPSANEIVEVVLQRGLSDHTLKFWRTARYVAIVAFVATLYDPERWKGTTDEHDASATTTQVLAPPEQNAPTELTPQETPQQEPPAPTSSNEGASATQEDRYLQALRVFREDLARARALLSALNVPSEQAQSSLASLRVAAEFDSALWDSSRSLALQGAQILEDSRARLTSRSHAARVTGQDASTYLVACCVSRFLTEEEALRVSHGALASRYADLTRAETTEASVLGHVLATQRTTLAQVDATLELLIDALEIADDFQTLLGELTNLFETSRSNLQSYAGRFAGTNDARSGSTQRFLDALQAQERACSAMTARIETLAQKTSDSPELETFIQEALANAQFDATERVDATLVPELSNLENSLQALRHDASLQRWGRVTTRLAEPWTLLTALGNDLTRSAAQCYLSFLTLGLFPVTATSTDGTQDGIFDVASDADDVTTDELTAIASAQTQNDHAASEPSLMTRLAQRAQHALTVTLGSGDDADISVSDAPRASVDAPGDASERLNAQGGSPEESFVGAYDQGRDLKGVQSANETSFLAELPPYARKSLQEAQKWRAPQETLEHAREFRSALTRYEQARYSAAE